MIIYLSKDVDKYYPGITMFEIFKNRCIGDSLVWRKYEKKAKDSLEGSPRRRRRSKDGNVQALLKLQEWASNVLLLLRLLLGLPSKLSLAFFFIFPPY